MSFTHEFSCTLAARPAQVFAALTDSAALTSWFAECAEVGEATGGAYRFWGRHSLETPTASHATQRITRFDRDRALAFDWTLAGVPTEVTMVLSEEGEGTRVVLHHAVHGSMDRPRPKALVDDHWRLALGNLSMYVAGGNGIVLPDYSDPAPRIRQVVMIDAPRDVVFRCLIEPALINQWFGTKTAEVEPHVGGRYSVNWSYEVDGRSVQGGPTRILELVPNERLVLDWPDWRGDVSLDQQTISFELESVGTATRLTFVHAGFERAADFSDYPFGWSWFLAELTKAVATLSRDTPDEAGATRADVEPGQTAGRS